VFAKCLFLSCFFRVGRSDNDNHSAICYRETGSKGQINPFPEFPRKLTCLTPAASFSRMPHRDLARSRAGVRGPPVLAQTFGLSHHLRARLAAVAFAQ
jgi:hypothetical protein